MQAVSVTHILVLANIRRARMLPVKGQVLVHGGQKVAATDVIASGNPGNEHILLDVRRALNIERIDQLEFVIQRKVGEKLQKDDVIAETGGLFKRVFRMPVDGQIVSISGGQILVEVTGKTLEIQAGFAGTVIEQIPDRGAILETSGSLVQGVWGNGKVNQGMLLAFAIRSPSDALTSKNIDVSMRGAVIMAGHCSQADTLRFGAELPLRGLILGSITADLVPVAREMDYPIMVVDGFGNIPMNSAAYKILSTNEKRDICLNASHWDPFSGERPEAIIPIQATGQPAVEVTEIKSGKTVRVVSRPYTGQIGMITSLLSGLTTLPGGLRAPSASVRLENGDQISIPLANLDVLE